MFGKLEFSGTYRTKYLQQSEENTFITLNTQQKTLIRTHKKLQEELSFT
jgi:hypothetical protein